jgi:hypothetical protein
MYHMRFSKNWSDEEWSIFDQGNQKLLWDDNPWRDCVGVWGCGGVGVFGKFEGTCQHSNLLLC